ncbi:MAG: universal stress protein, partial [Alphaproteobacteria bacterium]|nr:universal stress protein [Alphaproteobacteria bacterium]
VAGPKSAQNTLPTALLVARRFGGHVDALHIRVDPMRQLMIADETMIPSRLQELENVQINITERARAARAAFDMWLADNQVALRDDPPDAGAPDAGGPAAGAVSASWDDITGTEADEVARRGGAYDLIVADMALARARDASRDALESALFSTGRPALLAPPEPPAQLGETILLGWNRTAQSARTVQGAMPLLERAKRVVVLMVATGAKEGPGPGEIARTLAWHGIKTEVREIEPDRRSVGQILLEDATAVQADLLVMGAYSHSRWREKILGGVTKYVIDHADLPVFLAH